MNNRQQEIYEAINAGEQLYFALERAEDQLSSAHNWGIVDIFGGKSFSTFMKHNRISKAERELNNIQYLMTHFQKELGDISYMLGNTIDISNIMVFADYFMDGWLVDFMVQSKINDAQKNVRNLKIETARIIDQLRALI